MDRRTGLSDLRRIGLRYVLPLVIVIAAVRVMLALVSPSEVYEVLRRVDAVPYAIAVLCFYVTFPLRAFRWTYLLRGTEAETDQRSANLMLLLNWFMNTVLPAKAGDFYRSYLAKENYGIATSTAFGTIAAERVIDLIVLGTGLFATMWLVLGHFGDRERAVLLAAGGMLLLLATGSVAVVYAHRLPVPSLVAEFVESFQRGFTAIGTVRRLIVVLSISILTWSMNVVRIHFVTVAIGYQMDPAVILLLALLIAFLSGLPYTPAGVGVLEVVSTTVLARAGIAENVGFAVILLDRLVTVGSLVVVGGIVYVWFRSRGRLSHLGPARP